MKYLVHVLFILVVTASSTQPSHAAIKANASTSDQLVFSSIKLKTGIRLHYAQQGLRVYEDTGHALHWERPQEFAKDLQDFIESR